MKFKSITIILTILLFTGSIAEFMIIFMKLKLPTTIETISTILLFSVSISEFMRTRKPRKLAYPLIVIYFFVGMPIIYEFIYNRVLYMGFNLLGFIITMIFIYSELITSIKEKELSH